MEPNPVNRKVYAALTNNLNRGTAAVPVDEANPLASSHVRDSLGDPLTTASGNRNGYVMELTEDGDDPASTTFSWLLFLVCGDPEAQEVYFGGYPGEDVSPISCPDNVAFDSRRQPLDRHRRQRPRLERRDLPRAGGRAGARPGPPVPHGAGGRGGLRAAGHRR